MAADAREPLQIAEEKLPVIVYTRVRLQIAEEKHPVAVGSRKQLQVPRYSERHYRSNAHCLPATQR